MRSALAKEDDMAHRTGQQTLPPQASGHASGKRHWGRWVAAGVAGLVVLLVVAVGLFIKLQPTPAPLILSSGAASAPAGRLDGTWDVAAGSLAGFRVQETALGFSNDTVGRTSVATGALVMSGGRLTSAAVRVDLTAVKVGGKTQPQFAKSLGTARYPMATFTLAYPVTLSPAFASGATIRVTATGLLELNGISRPVSFTVSGRRDGTALQVAGSIPIAFSTWDIKGPSGYGFLGSLANHGVAEFLLILHRG
jgi:polyisoprenoid-binding protein YceI